MKKVGSSLMKMYMKIMNGICGGKPVDSEHLTITNCILGRESTTVPKLQVNCKHANSDGEL